MKFLAWFSKYLKYLLVFLIGIAIGGYLFSGVQPRTFITPSGCFAKCFSKSEFLGLLASVGIQRTGGTFFPIVLETDKTIVINDPDKLATEKYNFIIIPKKDIHDAADISEEDQAYLIDAFNVIHKLVAQYHLTSFKVVSNGPGFRKMAYLHFHLIAQ